MADTRDFLPKADPPPAEKSSMLQSFVNLTDVRRAPGAYVVVGDGGTYMYKGCARDLNKRLAELGKPLAPSAVTGLSEYVDRWQSKTRQEQVAEFAQAAREEAQLCSDLMHTEHRRRGINAILSKSLPDRVPVFD